MKTSVKRRAKNCIRGAVLLACFIAVWYVASCFTQPLFIPAPATVWEAIVGLAETGQLQKGLAYSFLRITGASALSMLVAIPLSLLIYGVKPIKETIMPVVSFLRYVPVTAFSPLLILLMDEPLSALDDKTRSKMQRLILDVHAETGNTIIMVTHSQDEAFKMCDKIIKFETRGAVTNHGRFI